MTEMICRHILNQWLKALFSHNQIEEWTYLSCNKYVCYLTNVFRFHIIKQEISILCIEHGEHTIGRETPESERDAAGIPGLLASAGGESSWRPSAWPLPGSFPFCNRPQDSH